MAVEDVNAETALADDIRSALTAALATREVDAVEPAAKPAPKAKANAEPDGTEDATGTEGEASEPAPKEKKASKGEQAEPEGEAADSDADKEAAEKAEKEKAEAAKAEAALTAKWSSKDKEILKTLPTEARDFLLRRHKEMEVTLGKKLQENAAFRQQYEPVDKIFDPYRDQMKQSGYTPQTLIQAWANVEDRLMKGDGVAVVAGLINGYKIDLGKVAQALGIRPQRAVAQEGETQSAAEGQPPQQIQLPPQLMAEINSLRHRVDAEDRRRADEAQRSRTASEQRVMTEIKTFKSAQDDRGNMLHPHFDELESEMTLLAKAAIEARLPVPSLQELYEKAVWATPSTRDAAFAARDRAQQEKAAAEARAKAAKAKKAGSSVTGAPGSGQAQPARQIERSLREQLEAAAEESLA